jgi:hypothetical protein
MDHVVHDREPHKAVSSPTIAPSPSPPRMPRAGSGVSRQAELSMPNRTTGRRGALPGFLGDVDPKPFPGSRASPDAVETTALLCFILSVQPRSKHRFVSAAPTATRRSVCGRRSVQSKHSRQNSGRGAFTADRSIPNSGEKSGARPRDLSRIVADRDVCMRDQGIGENQR